MALNDKDFADIKKFYDNNNCRMLANAKNIPNEIQFFKIDNINLNNYSFDPQVTPKTWWESGVIIYNPEPKKDYCKTTFSPEPDFTRDNPGTLINKDAWLNLMLDENQTSRDAWYAKYAEPTDWGYDSKTTEFQFKKACLAIDVAKRYDAWGDRMYDMFKMQNPTHAEFFLKTNALSNTAYMLSHSYSCLNMIDLKSLNAEQLEFWAKLMLYTVDKKVALSEIHNPSYKASDIDTREWAYKKIRSSALPQETIKLMLPPETKEQPGYLSQATSFLSTMVYSGLGFLPGYKAQQDLALIENEKLITTKITAIQQQLTEELKKIPSDRPIKSTNTIIGKINELLIYITLNNIDASKSISANNFVKTNLTNALNNFNQVPLDANITVLEKAQAACDTFKECYARSAALLKTPTTNDEKLQMIDAFHQRFTDRIPRAHKETKKSL